MNYWLGPDAFILQVGQNEMLDKLSNCLQFKEEEFIPHLTLAKKTGQLMHPVMLEEFEQTWRIEHFSLMASYHGLIYFEKKRWKLI